LSPCDREPPQRTWQSANGSDMSGRQENNRGRAQTTRLMATPNLPGTCRRGPGALFHPLQPTKRSQVRFPSKSRLLSVAVLVQNRVPKQKKPAFDLALQVPPFPLSIQLHSHCAKFRPRVWLWCSPPALLERRCKLFLRYLGCDFSSVLFCGLSVVFWLRRRQERGGGGGWEYQRGSSFILVFCARLGRFDREFKVFADCLLLAW
jgi:hypothetical protein